MNLLPAPFASPARLFLLFILAISLLMPVAARADTGEAQTAWRLLDYIAVDYPGAVAEGKVTSEVEYGEMREFSATAKAKIAALPATKQKAGLLAQAARLETAIANKRSPESVGVLARNLAEAVLAAYPVALAPPSSPDLARGAALYTQQCAACHGVGGAGDGPLSTGMDPAPIAFTDRGRAAQRSVFALYQVIDQGVEGTAMPSFSHLSTADKWALAFRAGGFASTPQLAVQGKALWKNDPQLRARFPDLEAVTATSAAALAREIGADRAVAVIAYLRTDPAAVASPDGAQSLDVARDLLRQSLDTYAKGDRAAARDLALAAYLDGFEPVETILATQHGGLVAQVEKAMGGFRTALANGEPIDGLRARAERIDTLFDEAEIALAPEQASSAATFFGAFAILLREGLEALLIVVAMVTFLIKADRRDLLRYVHAGWLGALAAGVGTWWIATNLITISGSDRELTEGFGSLLAAVILILVGIWMHGKAQAGAWQAYVRDKLDKALSHGSVWLLFTLSFVAVYREVFETIIFYAALGSQGDGVALFGGMAVALVLLAVLAWAMLRFSQRLPIAKFFAYSAGLIAVLAVVLAGKGIAALQEAGMVGYTALDGFPRSPMLGVYPTMETVAAQAATMLLLVIGFVYSRRAAPVTGAVAMVTKS